MNEKYRREEAERQRADGSKVYGDEEHKERLQAIEREHAAAFERIDSDVARKFAAAEEALLVAENADPAGSLPTEELQRAAAMNQFVAGEVEGLSLANLARRCRVAAGTGDRASMYALQHHAARRVDEDVTGEVREAVAELRRASTRT